MKQGCLERSRAIAVAKPESKSFHHNIRFCFAAFGLCAILVAFWTVGMAQAASGAVKIELNKVEQTDKGCRFYWLINNQSERDLKELDVSFYWFKADGIIGGDLRFAFAPAGAKSLKVKQYMLANKTCKDFASLLVNEITKCTSAEGPVSECASTLAYATRTSIEFLK